MCARAATPRFFLAITARNVRPWLSFLVESLARQTWPRWEAAFVDDASSDGTAEALQGLIGEKGLADRFRIIRNRERRYKPANAYRVIRQLARPRDVVVMLDGDDRLARPGALERLAREYRAGWHVVWSNWRGTDGTRGSSWHLDPWTSPRRQPWVTSHLFSFRRWLFDAVTEDDLKDARGRGRKTAGDIALALPILDQTLRRKHIEEVLYVYNRHNPASDDRRGRRLGPLVSDAQARAAAIVAAKPAKPLRPDPRFLAANRAYFARAARRAAALRLRS